MPGSQEGRARQAARRVGHARQPGGLGAPGSQEGWARQAARRVGHARQPAARSAHEKNVYVVLKNTRTPGVERQSGGLGGRGEGVVDLCATPAAASCASCKRGAA
eukprot:365455-Chlamydomonas_euryale.AAC.27